MTARKLTLGDLVGYTDLHLRLLTGEHGLDRQVRGAHATELEQPTRWLEADDVMLTVGTRLTTAPPAAQRQLVRELEQARIAALGFGTGLGFDVVPEDVLAEAAALDFPVFEVPFATPFRSVVSFVHESIASDQAFDLRRRLSIEHHLMEALGQPDAEHELFRRIAGVARGSVALVSAGGRVLHQEGSVPTDAIRRRAAPCRGCASSASTSTGSRSSRWRSGSTS